MRTTFFLITCLFLFSSLALPAQPRVWVYFSDKGPHASERLSQPDSLLSAASLSRRTALGIGLSEQDLPVYAPYCAQLRASLKGRPLQQRSRWLNAVSVCLSPAEQAQVAALPFVRGLQPVATLVEARVTTADDSFAYGRAERQLEMLNLPPLHQRGLTGKGVRIAVLDAGFPGVDELAAFDSLRSQGRLLATYDFVEDTSFVYAHSQHGTQVLSTIGAWLPGELIGTAPDASFLLARTEEARTETRQEEDQWVAAVEWADSIGVDVIHSSLGYSVFYSEPGEQYYHEDLDGNTAVTTRAADAAAARGILVTISAGNEGNNRWRKIVVPCDGDSVLCVGGVDSREEITRFSSQGPAADGRVKPDVVAMGQGTAVVSSNGRISGASGTSFAAPLMAGVVACLLQAHPDRPPYDIIQALRMSGNHFSRPDSLYGFGLPDAAKADSLLRIPEMDFSQVDLQQPGFVASRPVEIREVFPQETARARVERRKDELWVTLMSNEAQFDRIEWYYGEQRVNFPPKSMEREAGGVFIFPAKYLLPGTYEVRIFTDGFEERLSLKLEGEG
jgi:serine protease AprX